MKAANEQFRARINPNSQKATDPFMIPNPVNVRGTELIAGDTHERYRQKIARITLDSMVHFVGLLDAHGTVLEVNPAALDSVGIKLPDIEGKPLWKTVWWQVSEEINRGLREAIARASQGEFVRWDAEIFGGVKGGETIFVDTSLMPVKDEQGNVVLIVVEGRDITEKKAQEREIARQREELEKLRREAAEQEVRLRGEAELERRRLQDLVSQAPAGIGLMSGPEHRWTFVNDQYVRMTGRTSAVDFVGKTLLESLPELENQGFNELLDTVYSTGQSYLGKEHKAELKHSVTGRMEDVYFDFVFQPVRNAEGKIEGILVHVVEITDRVMARNALSESDRRFRALVTATSYSSYRMDPDWTGLRQLEEGEGHSEIDPQNKEWLHEYIYPEDQPDVACMIEDAIRTKSIFQLEHRVRLADGSVGWTFSRAVPVLDEKGDVTEWFGTATDVTDRRRSDENRSRLATIIDSADDAILSKDLKGIVGSWNEGAHRMFGYSAEEMVGKSILQLIPKELHYEEDEILRKLRAGERIDHYETRRRKKNGETVEVSVTISPIRDESGKIVGASKIARDISDRKRIERLLVQSEKLAATGRMAAAIAHEINNPLEALVNLIYLARQSCDKDGKAHGYLLTAEEELERVSHIARQTLGYYRDTGLPAEVYFHDLIENVLTVYNSKLISAGISTDLRFNDLKKVLVSKGEMLQVLSNIIANAVDAMPRGGVLAISARSLISSTGDGVQMVIRDSGKGIRQEHLQQVFEPFFTTKGDLGTGIGLWVAKQLVETRGGQISVASSTEAGGSGTTLTIFIPFESPVVRVKDAIQ